MCVDVDTNLLWHRRSMRLRAIKKSHQDSILLREVELSFDFMKLRIQEKILIGYAIGIACSITIGIFTYGANVASVKALQGVHLVAEIRKVAFQLRLQMSAAESAQRGFVLTGQEIYLDPFERSIAEVGPLIDTLEALQRRQTRVNLDISRIRGLTDQEIEGFKVMIVARREKGFDAALEMVLAGTGRSLMEDFMMTMERFRKSLDDSANELAEEGSREVARTQSIILYGTMGTALVILCAAVLLARNISAPLRLLTVAAERISIGDIGSESVRSERSDEVGSLSRAFDVMRQYLRRMSESSRAVAAGDLSVEVQVASSADEFGRSQSEMIRRLSELVEQVQRSGVQVNSSAVEIAATTRQQQTTATEVASTSAEISAAAKEVSTTSSDLLRTADEVNSVAEQAASLATDGKTGLVRMEAIMHQIMQAAGAINVKLGVMSEKASNITSVVTTISKVADQTNLLSLNAAIEAEKAGDYGKGFSVVASEIRRLSDQTAASTADIEKIVKEMVSAVSAGVMGMDKFSEELRRGATEISEVGRQLDHVVERVQSLAPSVDTLNEGMRSQNLGAQQISDALSQLGEAARHTADSIRESSRVVEQLNEASRGLQLGVSQFKLRK